MLRQPDSCGEMTDLGRSGLELSEEVWHEGRVLLQLAHYLHVVEQHHALQRCKGLVIQNLQHKKQCSLLTGGDSTEVSTHASHSRERRRNVNRSKLGALMCTASSFMTGPSHHARYHVIFANYSNEVQD